MSFTLKLPDAKFNFGPHEGKTPKEVPDAYLADMAKLVRDDRIMDRTLAARITEEYNRRNYE